MPSPIVEVDYYVALTGDAEKIGLRREDDSVLEVFIGDVDIPIDDAYQYAYTETLLGAVGITPVDWPGLTVTFQSDGIKPIEVAAKCGFVRGEAGMVAPMTPVLSLYEGATLIDQYYGTQMWLPGDNSFSAGMSPSDTRVWPAGAHTVKVVASLTNLGGSGSGTATFFAYPGVSRAWIRSKLAHQ